MALRIPRVKGTNRSACSNAKDAYVDLTSRLTPNFGPCRFVVDLWVGWVFELKNAINCHFMTDPCLLKNVRIWDVLRKFLCTLDRTLHSLGRIRQHQFGSVRTK